MLDVSRDICQLFKADRHDGLHHERGRQSIVSKVKTGLNSFKDLKLPISEHSLAGYCALEQAPHEHQGRLRRRRAQADRPEPHASCKEVDKRTGYRTKQMLIAPILGGDSGTELIGVIQLINNKAGAAVRRAARGGRGRARARRSPSPSASASRCRGSVKTKYEYLIVDNVIAAGELELATAPRARKNKNVEDILIDEFQVKLPAIGAALAKFFGVPYEPFKADRIKPPDLLKNLKRDYVDAEPLDPARGLARTAWS